VVGDNRNGTVNLLVCIDITGPGATSRSPSGAKDYAQCMRELVDVHYPMPRSASCRITCRSTRLALSTRPSRPPKLAASCGAFDESLFLQHMNATVLIENAIRLTSLPCDTARLSIALQVKDRFRI